MGGGWLGADAAAGHRPREIREEEKAIGPDLKSIPKDGKNGRREDEWKD
jgi:hypothetical protein